MKYLALAAAVATVAAAQSISSDPTITSQSKAAPITETPGVEVLTLRVRGGGSCAVRKSSSEGPTAELIADPGCDALLPGLSQVRFWQERDDGSIVFATGGYEAIASFAVADGVAYESFEPHLPLISLSAEN